MIKPINLNERSIVEQIYQLQKKAYRVEAELIQFYSIPPLVETIEQLSSVEESFYGYIVAGELKGAISVTVNENQVEICRLMVDPSCFRKGVGRHLLQHIENVYLRIRQFSVTTGVKNTPAVQLYESEGYRQQSIEKREKNVAIVHYLKSK